MVWNETLLRQDPLLLIESTAANSFGIFVFYKYKITI